MNPYIWYISNEQCLTLFLPQPVSLAQQEQCWVLAQHIEQSPTWQQWIKETVVGMNTLSVYTHELSWTQLLQVQTQLQTLTQDIIAKQQNTGEKVARGRYVEIPVRYGGEYGPDLKSVAQMKNCDIAEIVRLHTKPVYTVYFIGFQAGFPYLGGLNEQLYLPRHDTPRLQVPAGSVGIGGQQTGIYPFASPGGWQLLGRTDTALFDITRDPVTLLQAGDSLKFVATEIIDD